MDRDFRIQAQGQIAPIWLTSNYTWIYFKQDLAEACCGQLQAAHRYLSEVFNETLPPVFIRPYTEALEYGATLFWFPAYDTQGNFQWSPFEAMAVTRFLNHVADTYITYAPRTQDEQTRFFFFFYALLQAANGGMTLEGISLHPKASAKRPKSDSVTTVFADS